MFHVFYVNDGRMLIPQISCLGLVLDLQKCIQEETKVDMHEQALYLPSGEVVASGAQLSAYMSAGSETNPIYLFRRMANFDKDKFTIAELAELEANYQSWQNALETVERSPNATVNDHLRLWRYGQQYEEKLFKSCGRLVTEHRHLHQAWLSVIKNLDAQSARSQKHVERHARNAARLDALRAKGMSDLADFDAVLETLSKIKIPRELLNTVAGVSPGAYRTPITASASGSAANSSPSSEGADGGGASGSAGDNLSLYDWISSADSAYSLSEIFNYLVDDLQNTDDSDLRDAQTRMHCLYAVLNKPEYREIKGIEKRLATLAAKLRKLEGMHTASAELVDHMLKETSVAALGYHRTQLPNFAVRFHEIYAVTHAILSSKAEVMKNILQRIASWVQQAYERLSIAGKRLVVFEEKFNGLRDRLRLVRQIREAPILYVTAVAEVIRRQALQKEFSTWIATFMEKCTKFIEGENKIRAEFYAKLGEHFLRNIFYDLSDEMPNFCPNLPPFDRNLPRVAISHLRQLRRTFPEMHELLNVTTPQVYSRLAVVDPNAPPPTPTASASTAAVAAATVTTTTTQAQSQTAGAVAASAFGASTVGGAPLRREESFFVREQTHNIATMNQNFPSSNWLSEEHIDMSPASQFFMASRPSGLAVSGSSSLHIDTMASPLELGPLSEFALSAAAADLHRASQMADDETNLHRLSLSPRKPSEPINILGSSHSNKNNNKTNTTANNNNNANDSANGTSTMLMDASTSTIRQQLSSSGKSSSPFGTPDSTFEGIEPMTGAAAATAAGRSPGTRYTAHSSSSRVSRPNTLPKGTKISESLEIFSPTEISEFIRAKCGDVNVTVRDVCAFFVSLRASVEALKSEMRDETQRNVSAIQRKLSALADAHKSELDALSAQKEAELADCVGEVRQKLEDENKELREIVEHERYLRKEKEKELDEQRRVAEKLNEDYLAVIKAKDDLHVDLLKLEQERSRLRQQLDVESSFDYLQIELKAVEQLLKRELTSEEVQEIKREIEKRKISKSEDSSLSSEHQSIPPCSFTSASSPTSSSAVAAAAAASASAASAAGQAKRRGEYEKAFRSKMELIVKGVEEKKNKEIIAQREEIEAEMRKESEIYVRKLKQRIVDLEERVNLFERVELESQKRTESASSTTQSSAGRPLMTDSALQVTPDELSALMEESCIVALNDNDAAAAARQLTKSNAFERTDSIAVATTTAAAAAAAAPDASKEATAKGSLAETDDRTNANATAENNAHDNSKENSASADDETPRPEARAAGDHALGATTLEKSQQTRIRARDIESMISLKNIHEGCSVLIMWNNAHNTYIIFCTSPMLYIVREQSLHRMGIDPSDPAKRRSWLFVTVDHMEICQIKKAANRYKLPVNTRFSWVTVLPLSLDIPASSSATVASTQANMVAAASVKNTTPVDEQQ